MYMYIHMGINNFLSHPHFYTKIKLQNKRRDEGVQQLL